jgi:hypothetical protein
MEVIKTVKKIILFIVSVLCMCMILPQGALAGDGVTILFTGDIYGQVTPARG